MEVLDPVVVSRGQSVIDVVLEDDNVGVWNFLCVYRRDKGGGVAVDSLVGEDA